jgi:hypothetical protein
MPRPKRHDIYDIDRAQLYALAACAKLIGTGGTPCCFVLRGTTSTQSGLSGRARSPFSMPGLKPIDKRTILRHAEASLPA